ncbi:MAG: hypothetical protein MUE45_05455 [Methanoregulaceae archaeon]|nr:hypothetical protein [Methanoregulaceae archaeon]
MNKIILLILALFLLTGSAMAQGIVSTTIIDAKGNFATSSSILLRPEMQWHPSDMLPPSQNNLVYSEDTYSNGITLVLIDRERTTLTDRLVVPPGVPPVEFTPDPRVTEVDTGSVYMEVLMREDREDQTPDISSAGTNFGTFRTSRNLMDIT